MKIVQNSSSYHHYQVRFPPLVILIDSGVSKDMAGYKENLSEVVEKESHLRVVLGDDSNYTVKGFGSTSLQLESNDLLHLNDVLYVPGMKRSIVSISSLEDKGYRVTFVDGNVLAWHKNSSMNTTKVIGVREERLYRLSTLPAQALVHDSLTSMSYGTKD